MEKSGDFLQNLSSKYDDSSYADKNQNAGDVDVYYDSVSPEASQNNEAATTNYGSSSHKTGLLYPSVYYDGSDDYFVADENWMTHSSWQWMYCLADGSYYHVETNTFCFYDPVTNQFYDAPTSDAPEEEVLVDGIHNDSTTENFMQYEGVIPPSTGLGEIYPDEYSASPSLEFYALHDSSQEQNDALSLPREDYFFIDFDKDIIICTADIMSNMKGKLEREDRHVSKERLPLDVISDSQACCFYSAIFDGHGGAVCAEYCVNHLLNNVMSTYRHARNTISKKLEKQQALQNHPVTLYDLGLTYSTDIEALRRALQKGFQLTDHNYLSIAEKKGLNDGNTFYHEMISSLRCTALAVLLYGPDDDGSLKIITAHAGDCRAVLCRSGEAIRLTEDHKPNRKDEKKRIEAAGGKVVEVKGVWRVIATVGKRMFGLSTARSIGDLHMKKPKNLVPSAPDLRVFTVDFHRDTFLVMGSDGIWDVISDQEACDIVNQYSEDNSAQKAAEALVTIAKERGSADDKTATVAFFAWRRDLLDPINEDTVS